MATTVGKLNEVAYYGYQADFDAFKTSPKIEVNSIYYVYESKIYYIYTGTEWLPM